MVPTPRAGVAMNLLLKRVSLSPVLVRVAPFAVFLALTVGQEWFNGAARYWFYLAKTFVGAWMLWTLRPFIPEMRWKFSAAAVVVGVAVWAVWIGLGDVLHGLGLNPAFAEIRKAGGYSWNPHAQFGEQSAGAWFFIAARILGASLIVPPLEEVFFRSFLYRYIAKPDFQSVPLGQFLWLPFVVTSVLFGFEHREWLAGILCGFAYQGLVCWKKRLDDAIAAHAITNFLLGLWVVSNRAWHFW